MSRNNSPDKATLEKLANVSERNADLLGSCDELGKRRHKHGAKTLYACSECWTPVEKLHDQAFKTFCNCGITKPHREFIYFDSKGEHRRWCELLQMEKALQICDLERQTELKINISGQCVGSYVCDFVYKKHGADGLSVIYEDFKGFDNPMSKFKRKCVEASRGIKITLTRSNHERSRKTLQS